jgi:hypothetical protein
MSRNLVDLALGEIMPLLDHFHDPLNQERRWRGFHSYWASAIVTQLSQTLPPGYYAEPQVNAGLQLETGVGAWDENKDGAREDRAVATMAYAACKPALVFPVDFAGLEEYAALVFHEDGGARLVGAIELVSPANKDRTSHRDAFIRKCATFLQEGVSLMIVDVVNRRSGNFHAELVRTLSPQSPLAELADADQLYAVAYRVAAANPDGLPQIESWPIELRVGLPLPTLPLWIDSDLAVPVHLEQTYQASCATLRIKVA